MLKEARETKELSLEDVQKITKIQLRYLKAIEKGDFSLMPGSFYTRAFIKEYATAVGLNPEEVLAEYEHELPSASGQDAIDYSQVSRSRKSSPSTKSPAVFSILPTIITVLLVIGVAFIIYIVATSPDNTNQPNENETNEQDGGTEVELRADDEIAEEDTDNTADENTDNGTDDELIVEDEPVEPVLELDEYKNQESTYTFTNPEDTVELVFETDKRNWLEVETAEGESLYREEFQSGESPLTIEEIDTSQIYLRFGEPTDLTISINGVTLELSEEIDPSAVQKVWINIKEDTE